MLNNESAIYSQGTYFLAIINPFKNTAGLHQRVLVAMWALQVYPHAGVFANKNINRNK